jgi:hypothetical protein
MYPSGLWSALRAEVPRFEGSDMTAIRRPGASSAAVLFGLAVTLVVAHVIAPEWSRRTGLDVWNLPSANSALRAATEEREEVEAFGDRSVRRREAANQISSQLASGTITLATATDEIMEVFHQDQGMPILLQSHFPAAPTVRHRFALHTIQRTKRFLSDDPDRCAVVTARLEKEYRELLGSPDGPTAP